MEGNSKIIAKVDEKKNSYYYEYLNETSPKDVNSMVSGINQESEDVEEEDLFAKIKNFNQATEKPENEYNPDMPIVDENIILQAQKEEELKRKQNEERYQKEQEEKLARQKDEEIERLKAELDAKNSKPNVSNNLFKFASKFIKKKDDDNELEELVKSKEETKEAPKTESKPKQPSLLSKKEKIDDIAGKNKNTASADEIKYLAFHDEFTGLLNKHALKELTSRSYSEYSVLYADINGLTQTNNELGHDYGDKLIKGTAETLAKIYTGDNLYRVGTDEFLIFLDGVSSVDDINNHINNINYTLKITSDLDDDLIYSLSIGYAIGNGKAVNDAIKEAEEAMAEDKKKYKEVNPDIIEDKSEESYNRLLSKNQQILKNGVADNHVQVTEDKMRNILDDIREDLFNVKCVFIASADFNTLLIYQDAGVFLETVSELPSFDFSYLYVLYSGGPRYYGSDAYTKEVTHLFEDIADALQTGKIRTTDDLKKIKGINIFQNICTDMM